MHTLVIALLKRMLPLYSKQLLAQVVCFLLKHGVCVICLVKRLACWDKSYIIGGLVYLLHDACFTFVPFFS